MNYIQQSQTDQAEAGGCVFCRAAAEPQADPANYVIDRGATAFVILNLYPYTSGHVMVVPYQHCANLDELTPAARAELMELTNQVVTVVGQVYRPQGFNLGMNLGAAAGAGIAEHLHLHIVPRWGGDTNFMTATAATRVLPEALEDTYTRLRTAWFAR
jgi:ATP adenylyltransferase